MLFLEIQIYSNIQIFLTQIFIRTFIRIRFFETNKFGYSFVQKHLYEYIRIFVRVKKNYANIFGYSFESKIWNEYIRIFVWVQILTNVTLWFVGMNRMDWILPTTPSIGGYLDPTVVLFWKEAEMQHFVRVWRFFSPPVRLLTGNPCCI